MSEDVIDAMPTKSFFVDMLTRDISLEQAVFDLVDNCVDGFKRAKIEGSKREFFVRIAMSSQGFSIVDNCGGFSRAIARNYAFRFGRAKGATSTPHSIGQFGVGMKRALFKFGKHFTVISATPEEEWAINVDVSAWEETPEWTFPWAKMPEVKSVDKENPGTEIKVTNLRPEVAAKFNVENFITAIIAGIRSKHRQFVSEGLQVSVNKTHVNASSLTLLIGREIAPAKAVIRFGEGDRELVARIAVGLGDSSPREAGWYVVCNGRVILEADRRAVTGWGLIEESSMKMLMPSYHNQFARFRGIVYFDSTDSSRVPWNTTKTDVDQDSAVWRQTFEKMLEMMRPVIQFLNELDKDIDEFTREHSPLHDVVSRGSQIRVTAESIGETSAFRAPARGTMVKGPRMVKIQYSRPLDDVEYLQEERGVPSAKAVGELAFDEMLEKQRS